MRQRWTRFGEWKHLLMKPNLRDHLWNTVAVMSWLGLAWLPLGQVHWSSRMMSAVQWPQTSTETFCLSVYRKMHPSELGAPSSSSQTMTTKHTAKASKGFIMGRCYKFVVIQAMPASAFLTYFIQNDSFVNICWWLVHQKPASKLTPETFFLCRCTAVFIINYMQIKHINPSAGGERESHLRKVKIVINKLKWVAGLLEEQQTFGLDFLTLVECSPLFVWFSKSLSVNRWYLVSYKTSVTMFPVWIFMKLFVWIRSRDCL